MPRVALQPGLLYTAAQNEIVALPGGPVMRVVTSAAVESSLKEGGPWTALTGANTLGGVDTPGGFIRCTTAACDMLASNY